MGVVMRGPLVDGNGQHLIVPMSTLQLRCYPRCPHCQYWTEGTGDPPYDFLQLLKKLQPSQNAKFN